MKKISVIVPVYNIEKYLPYCLDSIIKQTYDNFEIVLVNDGSTDNCAKICDEYANRNENIVVIHKSNGGLSDARNCGVDQASGEYVTFIDGDDYVHELYLEMLMVSLISTSAEISLVDLKRVSSFNEKNKINKEKIDVNAYKSREAIEKILYQNFHDVSAAGILIPKSIAQKNRFPKGRIFEDLFTTYKFFKTANKIAFVHSQLYYYYQRPGSIMHKMTPQYLKDLIEASNNLVSVFCEDEVLFRAAKSKRFSNYCSIVFKMEDDNSEELTEVIKVINKDKKEVALSSDCRLKNRAIAMILLLLSVRLTKKLVNVVYMCKL